jgi:hypothetical protein
MYRRYYFSFLLPPLYCVPLLYYTTIDRAGRAGVRGGGPDGWMEFERNEKRPQQRTVKVIFSLSLSPVSASLKYYFGCCSRNPQSLAESIACAPPHAPHIIQQRTAAFLFISQLLLIPIYVRTYTV